MTKTPVLLIAFNRPAQTHRVLAEIRRARPEKLFIAIDGPRPSHPDDEAKCREVRELLKEINWPCEQKTLIREENLGCRIGVSSAITWFFEQVEEGIILEDDCLPDPSFFPFCEELLSHFRTDERVGMVSGYNAAGSFDVQHSYTFSKYGHIWGWATWKRAWRAYDVSMRQWAAKENRAKLKAVIDDARQWNYRHWLYNEVFCGRRDTWDYQWEICRLLAGQVSVIPSQNLVENIGFGADATHTTQASSTMQLPRQAMKFPLAHREPTDTTPYDTVLRPRGRVPSPFVRNLKMNLKQALKLLTPPFIYDRARQIYAGSKKFKPRWNTLAYEPLTGVQFFCDPSGSWQKKMIEGTYDRFLFERVIAQKPAGKTIYDIGAHVGYHSLYFAALVGTEGHVYAFEPNTKNLERMRLILAHNQVLQDRIKIFDIAVSDKEGMAEFTFNDDVEGGRSSGNFIAGADTFWNRRVYAEKGFGKSAVRTMPVDLFTDRLGIRNAPDIIKLDVEGAESLALEGARQTLLSKKPIILIEVHSMKNMFQVTRLLDSLSYESEVIRTEHNGVCYLEARPKKN